MEKLDKSKEALRESGSDVKDTLRESGADVKETAASTAAQVRDQATEQVRSVADTAVEQTKQTVTSFGHGLEHEANEQSLRIAALLDGLGGELDEMSQNGSGWASALVADAAGRTKDLARWVETTEPRDMLGGVEDFARRRPVAFIAGSALAGLIVGRLTRGMISSNGSGGSGQSGSTPSRYTSSGYTGYTTSPAYASSGPTGSGLADSGYAGTGYGESAYAQGASRPFTEATGYPEEGSRTTIGDPLTSSGLPDALRPTATGGPGTITRSGFEEADS